MATKKKGFLTVSGEWAKHLRKWGKRVFWKGERKVAKHRGGNIPTYGCTSQGRRRATAKGKVSGHHVERAHPTSHEVASRMDRGIIFVIDILKTAQSY